MRIDAIEVDAFRGLSGRFELADRVGLLVGENNSGKSSVIDAVRLVLGSRIGQADRLAPQISDFLRGPDGERLSDSFTVDLHLSDLNPAQRARMVTCLTPRRDDSTARIGLRCDLAADGRVLRTWRGGDLGADVEEHARSAVTCSYLPPLRDAVSDLRPGRGNRVGALAVAHAPADDPDRQKVEDIIREANAALLKVPAIKRADSSLADQLGRMLGSIYKQETQIAFADPRFDTIVNGLRALIGDEHPLEMIESGLGYNNLLYMATILGTLGQGPEGELDVLLVEEPEAHLHPQLQDLLMDFLTLSASETVQVLVTTHSPTLASSTGIEKITAVERRSSGTSSGIALASVVTDQKDRDHLRRFLDVTKSQLLFARGVLLVEGVAEQLLMPAFADLLDLPLHEHGISVVNVDGLAFEPFAALFADNGLPRRCALVTDSDPVTPEPTADQPAPDPTPSDAAKKLSALTGEHLHPFLATETFEYDLVTAGNWTICCDALAHIHPRVAAVLHQMHDESAVEDQAAAFLEKISDRKGSFALALADEIADQTGPGERFLIPPYLTDALRWVTSTSTDASSALGS